MYDSCLSEPVTDDMTLIRKKASEGVNEITCVEVTSLFEGGKLNYTGAEKAAYEPLSNGSLDFAADIKRCRLAGVRPLPEKVQAGQGFDFAEEEQTSLGTMPEELKEYRALNLKGGASREKQWERRLLDLSLRNTLLNFRPGKNSVQIISADLRETVEYIQNEKELNLFECPDGSAVYQPFSTSAGNSAVRELLRLEMKNKRLLTSLGKDGLSQQLSAVYRKERTAIEETGAGSLY
ncbi:MAG: DUF4011 domain-containing protein, partial [Clostridia bacterium]|nr:DUF4011 domain-containing protein [Clostridia bacterium]